MRFVKYDENGNRKLIFSLAQFIAFDILGLFIIGCDFYIEHIGAYPNWVRIVMGIFVVFCYIGITFQWYLNGIDTGMNLPLKPIEDDCTGDCENCPHYDEEYPFVTITDDIPKGWKNYAIDKVESIRIKYEDGTTIDLPKNIIDYFNIEYSVSDIVVSITLNAGVAFPMNELLISKIVIEEGIANLEDPEAEAIRRITLDGLMLVESLENALGDGIERYVSLSIKGKRKL